MGCCVRMHKDLYFFIQFNKYSFGFKRTFIIHSISYLYYFLNIISILLLNQKLCQIKAKSSMPISTKATPITFLAQKEGSALNEQRADLMDSIAF